MTASPRAVGHTLTLTNLLCYSHTLITNIPRTREHGFHTKTLQNAYKTRRHYTEPTHDLRRPPRCAPACTHIHAPSAPQPAGEPAPARHPSEPSTRPRAARPRPPRPLLRAARAPSVPSTPGAALPSPTRRARLGHDRRRAPTARSVAGRHSASSWLDFRHEGGGTTRGELGV